MSVVISPITLAGSGGGVLQTQYTMVYSGANLSPLLFQVAYGWQSPESGTDFILPAISGSTFTWTRIGGGGNSTGPQAFMPIALINSRVQGRNQFAQGRLTAINTIGSSLGPAVLLAGNWGNRDGNTNADGGNGYHLTPSTAAFPANFFLRRATITETALTTIGGWAFNDVARLEVYVNTPSAGQFTLKTYRNGSLVDTTVDAAGSPPAPQPGAGYPGFYCGGIPIPTNSSQTWDQMSWGLI